MNALPDLIRRLEQAEALDRLAKPLAAAIGRGVAPRAVRNLLSGTYVGHPLHPMLTDVPIGAWGMSALLDTVGGSAAEGAADLLVAAGVLAAVPTAASGLNDWSDTYGPDTRVGLVHAAVNTTALSLYTASLLSRAHGKRARGKVLGLAGFAVLLAGSYLGGHLAFVRGSRRPAYQSCCTGRRGRCGHWRTPAATWVDRWTRARSATAVSSAPGTGAPSDSLTVPSCAARPAARSRITRRGFPGNTSKSAPSREGMSRARERKTARLRRPDRAPALKP